ncbi:MAG TPA: ShlB/FhaC/HecB family hemolysin secretion/activation protein [Sphingomicrobium sp.]|nr:ShlB/FhaC/HecB family hemolysin secretion/activation protein [Sphingomicrobium sp.]
MPKPTVPAPTPQVHVSTEASRVAPCPLAASNLSVTLESVTFSDGKGGALPPQMAKLLADIEPRPGATQVAQLCELRDEAAARLLAAGYIAAVTIPQQEITRDARTARLTVIPARLVRVEIVGDAGPQAARVAARAERLKSLYPLRTADLERELLLASDNPGLDVKILLVPAGTGPGEVVGRLQVVRRTFNVLTNLQNYGSNAVGPQIGSVRAELYGLTGLADVSFVGASSTADFKEQRTVQGGHYFTLDSGATFGGSVAYAKSRPDLGALDLRSDSLLVALEGYAPFVRTVAARGTFGGGLEIVEQESKLFGGETAVPLTRDKLRVAFLKLQYSRRGLRFDGAEAWSIDGTLQLRKGLDILDATDRGEADGLFAPSRLEGDPTAFLIRAGSSARVQTGRFALLTRVEGQYSEKPLLAFEEYSVGNYTIGRGYDPSVTSGDSALGARLQPSFYVPTGRAVIEPYAFADAVRIWNEDTFATEDGRTLVSAGLGARLYLANRFVLDAAWAHPFDKPLDLPDGDRAPDRFLLSLTASFGPSAR